MILATFTLLTSALTPTAPIAGTSAPDPTPDVIAIKARRAIVGDGTEIPHAVILVADGRIVTIGQDLPIERGIPILELDDDQVVMPGLVDPYSRFGLSGGGFNDSRPQVMASAELRAGVFGPALEAGVTTLGLYPAGTGIPGQAVAIRPEGTVEDMVLGDGAYLKVVMRNSSSNKRNLTKGFASVAKYREKVAKEREKWEKKNKKSSSSKKSSSKKDEGDEKKADDKKPSSRSSSKKKSEPFVPPVPDPDVAAFLALMDGDLSALVSIGNAASYDHFIDALGDQEIQWNLRLPLSRESDFFYVMDKIGEAGCYVLTDPAITLHPGTMRQRNIPAELERAGAKVVLLPRADSASGFKRWLEDIGVLIGAGYDAKAAVRAVTQFPAEFLGLGDDLGTLAEGKRANLLILSGDPFQPGTEVDAVMLDGDIVHGEVNL